MFIDIYVKEDIALNRGNNYIKKSKYYIYISSGLNTMKIYLDKFYWNQFNVLITLMLPMRYMNNKFIYFDLTYNTIWYVVLICKLSSD